MNPAGLIDDLESAATTDDGAYSTRELQQVWNCGEQKARRLLRQFMDAGQVEVVDRKATTLSGGVCTVKAYRFVKPTRKKKR